MANANITPQYLTYSKDEVQAMLDAINSSSTVTEDDVRSIVTEYSDSQTQTSEVSE